MSRSEIPLGPPEITAADIEAVTRVLATTRLSRGPAEARFERRVATVAGVRHAIAVNSGTTGLQLALTALDIGPGDEVITTPYSFVASANALLHVGATPVFVDIDPRSLNIDPAAVEDAVTPRTRAILPVHIYGRCAAMPALRSIADRAGLTIVEDACEAIGSCIGGRRAGGWGDVAVLSFYPNKQITTGEGGVITTDREGIARRLDLLRNQGRVPSADGFDQVALGYSARLPEMSCALGASQIERLDEVIERRAAIVDAYRERLEGIEEVLLPAPAGDNETISWFVYVVLLRQGPGGADRDRLMQQLAADGIETARYFLPIHLQPLYRERFGYRRGSFPIAESVGERALALPFFNRLTLAQMDRVCESLRTHVRSL